MCDFNRNRNVYKANGLLPSIAIKPCNSKTICNKALILLQHKALSLWNALMQNCGFSKLHIVLGFRKQVIYGMTDCAFFIHKCVCIIILHMHVHSYICM